MCLIDSEILKTIDLVALEGLLKILLQKGEDLDNSEEISGFHSELAVFKTFMCLIRTYISISAKSTVFQNLVGLELQHPRGLLGYILDRDAQVTFLGLKCWQSLPFWVRDRLHDTVFISYPIG